MTDLNYPTTREAAVAMVLEALSEEQKEAIRATEFDEMNRLHHGLGMWIRNCLGLWKGNKALIRDLTDNPFVKPDDASELIIEAVWLTLQTDQARLNRAQEAIRARAASRARPLTLEELDELFDRED